MNTVTPTVMPTINPMLMCVGESGAVLGCDLDCTMLDPGQLVSFDPKVLTSRVETPHTPAPLV